MQNVESGLLCILKALNTSFFFSRSLKIGVNFAFVLTQKSAVKSSRRTRRVFSTIAISQAPTPYQFSINRANLKVIPRDKES